MIKMTRRPHVLILLLLVGVVYLVPFVQVAAETSNHDTRDLRVGERYAGGTRIRSPFVGVSFVVPPDWRAYLPSGSVIFLDSAVTPGLGTIHLLEEVTKETVLDQLSEPQSIEAGFLLHPIGPVQDDGTKLRGLYGAGEDIGIIVAILGPSSNAVIYQFIGRKTEEALYRQLAEDLASSTEFISELESQGLRRWYERLTGMVLTPRPESAITQGEASAELHLCSDGRFIRTIRLEPVPGRCEEGGVYHETGTWLIDVRNGTVGLSLRKSIGGSDYQGLSEQDGPVLVNGKEVSVEPSNNCL